MKFLATILFNGAFFIGWAQQVVNYKHYTDSLKKEMALATNDSTKARIAYEISYQTPASDSLISKEYLSQAKKLSGHNNFLNALYRFYLANYIYDFNTAASKAEYIAAEKELATFNTKEAFAFRAKCWRNYATLQQREDDENGMLHSLTTMAIPLAQQSGNKEIEGELYSLIGMVFLNGNIYDKAIEHYKKGLSVITQAHISSPYLLDIYEGIAKTYCFSDSLPQAWQAIEQLEILLKGKPPSVYTLALYDVESIYYRKIKNYEKALTAVDNGIALASELNDPHKKSSFQFNKYKIYFSQNRYPEALKTLQIVMNGPGINFLENKLMYYHAMSETYEKMGDTKNAYQWLKDLFTLWDSSYVEKMRTNIVDIEAKYQKSEKEKEILSLKIQQELAAKKKRVNTLIYLLVISSLISAIIITLLQLRNKKRKEQLLKTEILQMEQERKIVTYQALIDGQEKERNRLATELHDGLGGMLAAVKMNLSKTAKDVADINVIIENSTAKLDHSIQELRLIARNLMPPSLQKLGLINALSDFCEGLKTEKTNVVFQSYDVNEKALDENIKLFIYRIMQELITNAVRHSGAKEVLADLVQNDNTIQITVEDNGSGFDQTKNRQGIGLSNIRSRVDFLKGTMNIESNPKIGSTISITFSIDHAGRKD